FLPMTWVEFEYGGGGVCCIQALDLKHHQKMIESVNSL
ncbi:MAG: hypothetical protein ACJA0I_001927, partial [Gammaproteobacteria bacterium]